MKKTSFIHILAICFALLFLLTGCSNLVEQEEPQDTTGKNAICFSINTSPSRTILPFDSIEHELTYTVKGTKENETEVVFDLDSDYSKIASRGNIYVTDGTWSFTIEGYYNNSKVLSGTSEPTLISSTNCDVAVTLDWISEATGSVSVMLDFPTGSGLGTVKKVTAGLYNNQIAADSGAAQTIVAEDEDFSSVTFTQSGIESGLTKYIKFFLYASDGTLLGRYTETVFVAAGTTSSAKRALYTLKSSGTVTVTLLTDNSAYTGETKTLSLKDIEDESHSYSLTESSSGVYKADVINGYRYYLYEGDTNLYVVITSSSTDENATVDYCSTYDFVKTAISDDTATTSGFGVILTAKDTATTSISDLNTLLVARTDKVSVDLRNLTAVTTFEDGAFNYLDSLESIVIPKSVMTIGIGTFKYCCSLRRVVFEEGSALTSISEGAFQYCTKLTKLTIPKFVTTIGEGAFQECTKLTSITIPKNVTSIEAKTFENCIELESLTFEEGSMLTSIGECAFSYCYKLASITIPSSVISIGNSAFKNCEKLASITIPSKVTSIGEYLFNNCSALESVTFEDGVAFTSIGDYAFQNCEKLASIIIPSSVTSIGNSAFYNCSALTGVTFEDSAMVTSIGTSAFEYCEKLASITIPSKVTSIGNSAFRNCEKLASITIPSKVTSIGEYLFNNCSALESVIFEDGATFTSIGAYAFQNCAKLASITIPSSVTSIGNSAFKNCEKLASITIPKSVKTFETGVFYNCSGLESVTFEDGIELTSIVMSTFNGCKKLTDITIPSSVTSIGYVAFMDCEKLASITIPSKVTSIGERAFNDCSSLERVTFEDGIVLTTIGEWAFSTCSKLASITIPSNVTSIGGYAFESCKALTSVTFDSGSKLTSIGAGAFYKCTSFTDIAIPSSVTSIGTSCFLNDENLTISIDSGNMSYKTIWNGKGIISYDGTNLVECIDYASTSITIPENVTTIKEYAIRDCSLLTSITLPETLTTLENRAFYSCSSIVSLTIPSSVTSIGIYAFQYCFKLASLTIPSNVTSIGYNAFSYCSALASVTFEDTDYWYYADEDVTTGGTLLTISSTDTAANATLLKSTYLTKYWYKTDTAQ